MASILIAIFAVTVILSVLTTIPIIVSVILLAVVISRQSWVFFAALFLGLLIDLFLLRNLGATALFLTVFAGLILLYQRRFEIQTIPFVGISSFLGSIAYLKFFGGSYLFFEGLISSLFAVLIFRFIKNFNGKSVNQLTD